ncbi:hypothetical protein [Chryseobacterium taichungense]|uniref:hypothetical protein n=1 Tax=Chryseobacterium taichungense TaxID=295069 RepID=UPI001E3DA83A|nr:hypothetical protein [Chryseobacterium taichungense]
MKIFLNSLKSLSVYLFYGLPYIQRISSLTGYQTVERMLILPLFWEVKLMKTEHYQKGLKSGFRPAKNLSEKTV